MGDEKLDDGWVIACDGFVRKSHAWAAFGVEAVDGAVDGGADAAPP